MEKIWLFFNEIKYLHDFCLHFTFYFFSNTNMWLLFWSLAHGLLVFSWDIRIFLFWFLFTGFVVDTFFVSLQNRQTRVYVEKIKILKIFLIYYSLNEKDENSRQTFQRNLIAPLNPKASVIDFFTYAHQHRIKISWELWPRFCFYVPRKCSSTRQSFVSFCQPSLIGLTFNAQASHRRIHWKQTFRVTQIICSFAFIIVFSQLPNHLHAELTKVFSFEVHEANILYEPPHRRRESRLPCVLAVTRW